MSGLAVTKPGVLTCIQDSGRLGQLHNGLTTGGPMDQTSFDWANRLLGNAKNTNALEISIGGLELQSLVTSRIAITGAQLSLSINGEKKALWRSHSIYPRDRIKLGYAQQGCRAYLSVAGGFIIKPQFGSSSTVVREGIGGLDGGPIKTGDFLPCLHHSPHGLLKAPASAATLIESIDPQEPLSLRVILGQQIASFSDSQQQRFFNSEYRVSPACNRMGYRLEGAAIESTTQQLYSEGISYGAIQIPPDGQPIILLNDRQTLGGYPKLGSLLSLDCHRLAQRQQSQKVRFEEISIEEAQALRRDSQKIQSALKLEARS